MASDHENSRRKDPAWKYGYLPNPNDTNKVICTYCNKETNGGINRFKKHLVGGYKDVKMCPRCPKFVKDGLRKYMVRKKEVAKKSDANPCFDEVIKEEECKADKDTTTSGKRPISYPSCSLGYSSNQRGVASSQLKKSRQMSPIDSYFHRYKDEVVTQRKKDDKNSKKFDEYRKKLRDKAVQKFARWMYDAGIPLSAVKCDSFAPMIEAIGQYGAYLKELEHTETSMQNHEIQHLHSKRRTRVELQRFKDLILIECRALRCQNKRDDTIDESNEWMTRNVEEDENEEDVPVFDEPTCCYRSSSSESSKAAATNKEKRKTIIPSSPRCFLEEDDDVEEVDPECYNSFSSDMNGNWDDGEDEFDDGEDYFDDDGADY